MIENSVRKSANFWRARKQKVTVTVSIPEQSVFLEEIPVDNFVDNHFNIFSHGKLHKSIYTRKKGSTRLAVRTGYVCRHFFATTLAASAVQVGWWWSFASKRGSLLPCVLRSFLTCFHAVVVTLDCPSLSTCKVAGRVIENRGRKSGIEIELLPLLLPKFFVFCRNHDETKPKKRAYCCGR
jgi:hypothetical protein